MPLRSILILAAILAGLIVTRLCHSRIVWVEEAYPAAAAIQSADYGKTVYRDLWFDKPFGAAWFYRAFDARTGVPLRLAGALYAFLCAVAIYLAGRFLWGDAEGLAAAVALAWSLTFDEPSAILALAPDLGLVLPQILTAYFALRGEWYWSAPFFALGFWTNIKMLFAAPAMLWDLGAKRGFFWLWTSLLLIGLISFAAGDIWEAQLIQVWEWGRVYSSDTFLADPVREGVAQTGEWIFFHLAIITGAVLFLARTPKRRWFWLLWLSASFVAVCLGSRFAPRYYLQLLPAVCLMGAAGFIASPRRVQFALAAAMMIPALRFGPRYATLGADLLAGREHNWNALALYQDSVEVTAILARQSSETKPTLFVWGYRPDIWMLSRLPAATRFLDSQPINGVFADRHLINSRPSVTGDRLAEAQANLAEAAATRPDLIVDGLGPLNPELALERSPLWRFWAADYDVLARTRTSIVYGNRGGKRVQ